MVETLGGWSEEAADTITRIGCLLGIRLGLTPAESICHLFQRLSVSLWRGNATFGFTGYLPMWTVYYHYYSGMSIIRTRRDRTLSVTLTIP